MGYPLWDMLDDLALARGLMGAEADSDSSYLRGRVAAVLWIPGLAIAIFAGGFAGTWVVGAGVLALTLVVMLVVGIGPRRLLARVRGTVRAVESPDGDVAPGPAT